MNNEITQSSPRQASFERIQRFLSEGDITLSAQEELILHRWNYIHKLKLQRKYTEQQIKEKVAVVYNVSIYTAGDDIYKAEALFGGSIKTNKKYLLHHHAENIMLLIEKCKNDKSLVHLVPKLLDSYTKAVVAIPDEINKDKMPPPVMNFFLVPGQDLKPAKSYEEAIASIRRRNNVEDIDHEEINDNRSE